jgi:hypothetical protein
MLREYCLLVLIVLIVISSPALHMLSAGNRSRDVQQLIMRTTKKRRKYMYGFQVLGRERVREPACHFPNVVLRTMRRRQFWDCRDPPVVPKDCPIGIESHGFPITHRRKLTTCSQARGIDTMGSLEICSESWYCSQTQSGIKIRFPKRLNGH